MAITLNDVRKALDARSVPYQEPGMNNELILRGTADIIEGGYGYNNDEWDFYIRCTKDKPTRTFRFKTVDELNTLLDSHYVQQPYDAWSAKPL